MLSVASVNVNGVRAAVRRGMPTWLAQRAPDVLCLQEVRASDDDVAAALGEGWHTVHEEASAKGRAGVAVSTRTTPVAVRAGLAPTPAGEFDGAGRWVEADLATGSGTLTVISAYVHTGEADAPRQAEKEAFLEAAATRLAGLAAQGRHVLLTGDLNVAHREEDLKTGALAALAVKAQIDRAPSYAERWSDHAPVVVEYDLDLAHSRR